MVQLNGIDLAMQTHFEGSGAIDFGLSEQLVKSYIADRVHGSVLPRPQVNTRI